jgi:hypothetical protein
MTNAMLSLLVPAAIILALTVDVAVLVGIVRRHLTSQ